MMSPLSTVINLETLAPGTHDFHLDASHEEREDAANRLNLIFIEKLKADLKLERDGRVILTGKIHAQVTQQCVRTLVFFLQELEVKVDELFFLESPKKLSEETQEEGEMLEDYILDLGEVVIQILSLNLDPYPVAPGTEPLEYHEKNGNPSPFEVLKNKKEE